MKGQSWKGILCFILTVALLTGMSAVTAESQEPVKLTFWTAMDSKVANNCSSYEELLCMQKLEEILNVDVEWEHPPMGEETEQFNVNAAAHKDSSFPDYSLSWGTPFFTVAGHWKLFLRTLSVPSPSFYP